MYFLQLYILKNVCVINITPLYLPINSKTELTNLILDKKLNDTKTMGIQRTKSKIIELFSVNTLTNVSLSFVKSHKTTL